MLLRERLKRLVPRDREIIVRSHGHVRYLRIGRVIQSAILGVAVLALGWSAYASSRHLSHQTVLADRDSLIRKLSTDSKTLATNLSEVRNRVEIQDLSLTATQRTTVDLAANNQDMKFRIAELEGELKDRTLQGESLALSYMSALESHAGVVADLERLETAQLDLKRGLAEREARLAAVGASMARCWRSTMYWGRTWPTKLRPLNSGSTIFRACGTSWSACRLTSSS